MEHRSGHNPSCRPGGTIVSVKAPQAKDVFLAGTFNNWNTRSMPMTRTTTGEWVRTLDLAPGRYEYKFMIDGLWCCEPGCDKTYNGCPGCVANSFGTMNRLLLVEELPSRTPSRRASG